MKQISLRELHRNTGKWVRSARRHGRIVVCDRNVPIASLEPLSNHTPENPFAKWKPLKRFATLLEKPVSGQEPLMSAGVYFDSALIAKFYVNEPGRDAVRELARASGKVTSSAIAIAEVASAFHRKLREGAIDAQTFKALHGQFGHDVKTGLWTLVPVSEALLESVQAFFASLDKGVFLRSLDALHLMTAKAEGFEEIHTNDRHVLAGCAAAGIRATDSTR
jgi:predicted nucleic acid-binding protein/antitoxin (DNA-binding transcriptional repressor) of toxin-antitoxin stability system